MKVKGKRGRERREGRDNKSERKRGGGGEGRDEGYLYSYSKVMLIIKLSHLIPSMMAARSTVCIPSSSSTFLKERVRGG